MHEALLDETRQAPGPEVGQEGGAPLERSMAKDSTPDRMEAAPARGAGREVGLRVVCKPAGEEVGAGGVDGGVGWQSSVDFAQKLQPSPPA